MSRGLHGGNNNPASPPYSADQPYEMDTSLILQKPNVESSERCVLEETFKQLPQENASIAITTNLDFEVLGTGGSSDDVTFGATTSGILLTTDSTASQEVIIAPHLDSGQSAWTSTLWGTENQVIWEAVIRTGASVAAIVIWAGLKLTNVATVADDDDAAYFRFDAAVANWEATTSIAGTDVETDTGVVVAASTNYYLKIEIDSDRKARFFIDNQPVHTSTALTNDKDLIPYIGVQGNAKTLYVIKEKISRIIFE